MRKCDHLSIYHVKSQSMVIKMSKMVHFFVTVWAKYLTTSERSYLVLLENIMDYWVLSYY